MKKNNDTNLNITQLVDIHKVSQAIGLTRAGIFNLIRQGKFPTGTKYGHSRRWKLAEVNAWIENPQRSENSEI